VAKPDGIGLVKTRSRQALLWPGTGALLRLRAVAGFENTSWGGLKNSAATNYMSWFSFLVPSRYIVAKKALDF